MSTLLLALRAVWERVAAWAIKPPGLYVLAAVAAVLAFWLYGTHEYRAGQAACEAAHTAAAQAAVIAQDRRNTAAVAASEARTAAATKIEYRNREIIRYVAVKAATLPGGSDVCVPADIADGVRGLR